jgi:hypothetical protein
MSYGDSETYRISVCGKGETTAVRLAKRNRSRKILVEVGSGHVPSASGAL